MKNKHLLATSLGMALGVVLALAASSLGQTTTTTTTPPVLATETEKSFDKLKALAGSWEGPVSVDPPMPASMGSSDKPLHITMRVTSRGHALVHEMQEAGTPLDPALYDHPVTMLYTDGDQLLLTHYCDAGNRPRMTGKLSADGTKVEFAFLDMAGGNDYGHMFHAVFTIIDANHHTEDWTYMMPGDKPMHAHFDLQRK